MEVHLVMVEYDIHDQSPVRGYSDKAKALAKAKRLGKLQRRLARRAARRRGGVPAPHSEFWGELRTEDGYGVNPYHVTGYRVTTVPLG